MLEQACTKCAGPLSEQWLEGPGAQLGSLLYQPVVARALEASDRSNQLPLGACPCHLVHVTVSRVPRLLQTWQCVLAPKYGLPLYQLSEQEGTSLP